MGSYGSHERKCFECCGILIKGEQMYIYIFEDGGIKKVGLNHFSEDDLESVREGILEIIDITDPKNPTYYTGEFNEWAPLENGY